MYLMKRSRLLIEGRRYVVVALQAATLPGATP